jgi:hypothetical protein
LGTQASIELHVMMYSDGLIQNVNSADQMEIYKTTVIKNYIDMQWNKFTRKFYLVETLFTLSQLGTLTAYFWPRGTIEGSLPPQEEKGSEALFWVVVAQSIILALYYIFAYVSIKAKRAVHEDFISVRIIRTIIRIIVLFLAKYDVWMVVT